MVTRAPRASFRRALRLACVVGLLVIAAPSTVLAQGGSFFDDFGAGGRSAAMGNAMTGLADDASASYYNPAGLSYAPVETTIGWRYVKSRPKLDFADPDEEDVLFDTPSTRGLAINVLSALDHEGINERFPFIEPLTLGVSAFISLREVTSFQTFKSSTEPYFFRYDTRPSLLMMNFSLAYRFSDWISVGGGIMVNVNSLQDNLAQVRLIFPDDDPTEGVDLELEQEATSELVPVLGLMLKPPIPGLEDRLSFGFSYRGEIKNFFGTGKSDQSLGFRRDDGGFVELVFLPGDIVNLVGFAPEQFSLGVGFLPVAGWKIGLDATYKVWEEWRYWLDIAPEPGFSNTITVRLGGEYRLPLEAKIFDGYRLEGLDLRLGYMYEPTPTPKDSGRFNILDSDQHVVSAGVGIATRVLERWGMRTDLLFQAHIYEKRRFENANDPLFGPLEVSGTIYQLGIDFSFDF